MINTSGPISRIDAIPLRIPFADGSAAVGLMPQKWTHLDICLVRVETTDGIVGWGEAFAYACLSATTAAVRDMVAPLVVGRAVDDIPVLNRELQQKLHIQGRSGITVFAISGIDIALWDIAAKARGISLSEHLGGRRRETVPAYASLVRYGDPNLVRRFAEQAVADGYRDVKLHEITLPAIEAGRAAAGPQVRLTTDINCNWSLAEAERMLPEMKRLDLYWVEEPVFPPDDATVLAGLIERFGVAVASGENACTAAEFARTMPAVTYPQPSVTKVGGVSEFLKVCDLAQRAGKTPMPHSPYFGPGYWATLQLAAARPECGLFEYLLVEPEAWLSPGIPRPKDGQVAIPNAPGLGFQPDESVIRTYRQP
ncbi:MAG: mandelate racemase/muconate lactonizing enzyme family protein [Hyphomicrobiaceae bacterium]